MSIQNGTSLTKEALEYLVGLIRDISGLDSKLIDDINLKTNGTYSSVRIKSLIDKNLEEANKHTEDLISALNKLSSKKTNVQPTLDNSEFNVIYLYSTDGNAPFEQYLKIGTNDSDAELISLGSTNISLDEYLTVLDASKIYAEQVDLDTTNNSLSNHITDTDIHVTTSDKEKWNKVDNKVDKTDITTTIDSTSTNNEVVGAKAVYDFNINNIFNVSASIGFNIDTYKKPFIAHVNHNSGVIGTFPTEVEWGSIIQLPASGYRAQILITEQGMYYRIMHDEEWKPWYKVNATEVTDTTTYPKETT